MPTEKQVPETMEVLKDFGKFVSKNWTFGELQEKVVLFNATAPENIKIRLQLLMPLFHANLIPHITISNVGIFRTRSGIDHELIDYQFKCSAISQKRAKSTNFDLMGPVSEFLEASKEASNKFPFPTRPIVPNKTADIFNDSIAVFEQSNRPADMNDGWRIIKQIPMAKIKSIELLPEGEKFTLVITA